VRGKEVSRPFSDIVSEVTSLAASGVTEVTLLGQNVNSYGRDIKLAQRQAGGSERVQPMFANLLREVGAVPGIQRVRYTSPHPKDMRIDVLQAMAETPAVCEHLHYPLQAGSDRVLALMHRGYTAERYLERLADARRLMPDLAVTTDIIVGFPGETEEDFEELMEFVKETKFRSETVITVNAGSPLKEIIASLAKKGLIVGDGYGKLKESQFRVANFAAHSKQNFEDLISILEQI
jgi:tRNA-2-methylthio-N6-dimethylallyladenosine synthase